MKVKIPLDKSHRLINHGPIVLVSSFYKGRPNVCTVAWTMPVDFDPPKIACVIGDDNYTFKAVKATKEFVLNVPGKAIIEKAVGCGRCSGRDTDKFKKFNLTTLPASRVKAPLIKECIAHLECKLIRTDLADEYNIFLADVLCAWADKAVFKNGRLLVEKAAAKTIHHLGGSYFTFPSTIFSF